MTSENKLIEDLYVLQRSDGKYYRGAKYWKWTKRWRGAAILRKSSWNFIIPFLECKFELIDVREVIHKDNKR